MKGKVYLVGAGPGDPELLTLKALRLLRTAEAVLHDDLVAPEILKLIPPTAQIYNVGKRCGKKKILQGEINGLMAALASSGLRVVRLKGGDPLIFGRAGEEIESLRGNNIPFEIVPGVTSALGAAAAAQIPLTHRRASSALVLITAHRASERRASGNRAPEIEHGRLEQVGHQRSDAGDLYAGTKLLGYCEEADGGRTGRRDALRRHLARHHQRQRTHRTTVLDLHRAPQLAAPTLLVVGEVVRLADPAAMVDEFCCQSASRERQSASSGNFPRLSSNGATPGSK